MSTISGVQTGGQAFRTGATNGLDLVDDGADDVTDNSDVGAVLLAQAKMKRGGTQATVNVEGHKTFVGENSDALKAAARPQ